MVLTSSSLAAPAVQFLEQLLGQAAAGLAVIPEHAAADGQQDVAEVQVDDVGFLADAEVDRPVLALDLGVGHQVEQFGRFAAAAVSGEIEFRRPIEGRQECVGQFGDRVPGTVDVEGIWLAVRPGLERKVELEVQPGTVEIGG
jgi:hypothetical protein